MLIYNYYILKLNLPRDSVKGSIESLSLKIALSILKQYVFYAREMIYWQSPKCIQYICLYITKQIEAILSHTSSAAIMPSSM